MFVLSQNPCFPLGEFVKLSQTRNLFLGGFAKLSQAIVSPRGFRETVTDQKLFLSGFVKLSQAIVSPRGFRETVTDQKTFPFIGFAKLSQAKSSRRAKAFYSPRGFRETITDQNHFLFPLGDIVKLSLVLTLVPLFGNLFKHKRARTSTIRGKVGFKKN